MNNNEIWESAVRPTGDMAGVFELNEDAGYFYLYETTSKTGDRIKGAIHVFSGSPEFTQQDINICWTPDEKIVGLFIRGRLWAAFNSTTGAKYGGDYRANSLPIIPLEIARSFKSE